MTPKEKAIRKFAKAMRTADSTYYAKRFEHIDLTLNMRYAWFDFIEACLEEVKNGRP